MISKDFNPIRITTVKMQKYLQSDWWRGIKYISYCPINITLCKLPKIAEAKKIENIK